MGDGYFMHMDGSQESCDSCDGTGVVLRTDYVNTEAALTPEERAQIGEQHLETTSNSSHGWPSVKMTKEDAAEVILKGDIYIDCFVCKGSGKTTTSMTSTNRYFKTFQMKSEHACSSCDGIGKRRSSVYLYACKLLNLPEPPRPKQRDFPPPRRR